MAMTEYTLRNIIEQRLEKFFDAGLFTRTFRDEGDLYIEIEDTDYTLLETFNLSDLAKDIAQEIAER